MFLHYALREALLSGDTAIPCATYDQTYRDLQDTNSGGETQLEEQFEVSILIHLQVNTHSPWLV